jgi:hypothetical protein
MRAPWAGMVIAMEWALGVHAGSLYAESAHFGRTTSPVEMPGLGRELAAFIAVVALAAAVAMAIRRLSPWLPRRLQVPPSAPVTVLTRQVLEPGLRLYVVEISDERLAIIANRTTIAVHPLGGKAAPAERQPGNTGAVGL